VDTEEEVLVDADIEELTQFSFLKKRQFPLEPSLDDKCDD